MRLLGGLHPAILLAFALAACQDASSPNLAPEPAEPGSPPPAGGDAVAGRIAFVNDCAGCHTSRDGFDLAFFAFTDTTIVRRALPHVDLATAEDIVAHIRSLPVSPVTRDVRPFQPARSLLASDVEFAVGLFGADAWPADLATAQLLAIDPLDVAAAVPLPLWSIEANNLDWMPEASPPDGVLDYRVRNASPRELVARYYAQPTLENLIAAVSVLRAAERSPENAAAPCVVDPMERLERFDAGTCFEVRRWTSTLVAQHMLRTGLEDRLDPVLHDTWWDAGNAARHAGRDMGFEDRDVKWASWMYLGWIFEPSRHASVYTGNGLVRIGLPRHATFVALRSQVARPMGSGAPYADVEHAARFAPASWAFDVTSFGYRQLIERQLAGDLPRPIEAAEARVHVQDAYTAAARKVGMQAALAQLRDAVLANLP